MRRETAAYLHKLLGAQVVHSTGQGINEEAQVAYEHDVAFSSCLMSTPRDATHDLR